MLQVQDLQLFMQIVHTGNISKAAAQFQLTPAAASAALKRLEQHLQSQLLVRSTRSLRLTPAGERFLSHCQNALTALAQGEQELAMSQAQVGGELRLSAPSDLGRHLLLPWLDEFMQRHPAVRLRLELSDRSGWFVPRAGGFSATLRACARFCACGFCYCLSAAAGVCRAELSRNSSLRRMHPMYSLCSMRVCCI